MELLVATYSGEKLSRAGNTRHLVRGKSVDRFDALKIVQFGPQEFNILYFIDGEEVSDTGFGSLGECLTQAEFEFSIEPTEWTEMSRQSSL